MSNNVGSKTPLLWVEAFIISGRYSYVKKRVIASQHFREFWSAYRTISGYEAMNMIRKGQIENVKKGDILEQINFINSLFEIAV